MSDVTEESCILTQSARPGPGGAAPRDQRRLAAARPRRLPASWCCGDCPRHTGCVSPARRPDGHSEVTSASNGPRRPATTCDRAPGTMLSTLSSQTSVGLFGRRRPEPALAHAPRHQAAPRPAPSPRMVPRTTTHSQLDGGECQCCCLSRNKQNNNGQS